MDTDEELRSEQKSSLDYDRYLVGFEGGQLHRAQTQFEEKRGR